MTSALVTASSPATTSAGLVTRPAAGAMQSVMPVELEVSLRGTLAGKTARLVNVMGSRTQGWTSTAVLGDACEYLDTSQAAMNTPTVGQTLYVVSTSANDAAAGTGARTIRIVYLDANGLSDTDRHWC